MSTITFGNVVFLIIVGLTIYHNIFIEKKDAKWFLFYIPLITIAYIFSNVIWALIFPLM